MRSIRYILLTVSVVLFLFPSCTADKDMENVRTIHLSGLMGSIPQGKTTRTIPTGYEQFLPAASSDATESTIHLFIRSDEESAANKDCNLEYSQTSLDWKSDAQIYTGVQYYLYGFMPSKADASATIAPATDYKTGATITLTELSPVLPYDLCVLVGVESRGNPLTEDITSPGVSLVPGAFDYLAPYNDVYLYALLDHVYANLDVVISIDAEYDVLRTIRLKSCQIKTASGDAAKYSVTVPLASNTTGSDPIGIISYTGDGFATGGGCQLNVPDNFTLTTSQQVLHAYVCPAANPYYVMTTVYDVYDKNNNLIRSNATVVNSFSVGTTTPSRGQSLSINAVVAPTYLYQLSNPDFNNPTINIE